MSVTRVPATDGRQPATNQSWVLLDSASLYFRAFFGVPSSVTAPDGTQVNAVRGFLDMVGTVLSRYRPTHLVACWDEDWRPQWRVDLIPSYKAHRVQHMERQHTERQDAEDQDAEGQSAAEDVPDALPAQVPVIAELLEAFGIARLGAPGCEADDVIGTLVATLPAAARCDIVTGDRDLFQLVEETRPVRVLYIGKGGVRDPDIVDAAWLRRRYGIEGGDAYADLAVLRGDPSDGLPGVGGIGEKTAATLVSRFGSLEAILRAADARQNGVTVLQRTKLAQAADYLRVAPTVVRVLRDADLPRVDATVPARPAHPRVVEELAVRWGVTGSVRRVTEALADAAAGPARPAP
ncbi:MAG: flap endonuclease [Micrococcales bacterium]|nr:MAG: flap endonuclease [Micrococcales bacterium]PIE27404.1 MAG: flap endonuclease [Micrococcales bacterium]